MHVSGKIALFKRWFKIATGQNRVAVKQGQGQCYSKTALTGYYNDLTGKVNDQTMLDERGIPVNLIEGGSTVYFPISIFQYALGLWDLYLLKGEEKNKIHFLTICEWMIDHQAENGSWNCFGPIGYKKMTVSSMGQGEAASVLLRAYKLTNDVKWLNAAREAVKFMMIEVKNGGTLLNENGDITLEEYANLDGDKKTVLNGWIFSLFGLYDFLLIEHSEQVEAVFRASVETLKRKVPSYDCGYWSLYDATGRLASPAYHDLHIELLTVLGDLTNERAFIATAEKWKKYQLRKVNKIRAIAKKIVQKLNDSTEGILVK